jgi:SH3 domain protein
MMGRTVLQRLAVVAASLVICSIASGAAASETRYVTDVLVITVRENKGSGAKIKNIITGTPVTMLERSGEHVRIRTEDGTTGWVHGQYLTPETPKPVVIAELTKKIAQLRETVEELEKNQPEALAELQIARRRHTAEVKELERQLGHFREEAERSQANLSRISAQYALLAEHSQNVAELIEKHQKLQQDSERLQKELLRLREKNSRPRPPAVFWWFLGGAGVFAVGLIVGAVMRKKKYYIDVS